MRELQGSTKGAAMEYTSKYNLFKYGAKRKKASRYQEVKVKREYRNKEEIRKVTKKINSKVEGMEQEGRSNGAETKQKIPHTGDKESLDRCE